MSFTKIWVGHRIAIQAVTKVFSGPLSWGAFRKAPSVSKVPSTVANTSDVRNCFSNTYGEARNKFLAGTEESGAIVESIIHPERGPDGAELFVDVAAWGPRNPSRVVVVISGTHGVEGFCGSGIQTCLLSRCETSRLPPGLGVVFVHAINPYGFAWIRRVTHENVDLNRNWIDFDQLPARNQRYEQIRRFLIPEDWSEDQLAICEQGIKEFEDRYGHDDLMQAITGGQYHDPRGLFYGGDAACWSRRVQESILSEYCGRSESVTLLDLHTGLGPWGYGEQISTFPPDSAEFERARSIFGISVRSTRDGGSAAAKLSGDGQAGARRVLPQTRLATLAVEFGTIAQKDTHHALRADCWLHQSGDPASPLGQEIKRNLKAAFYSDCPAWQGMVLGQALACYREAISQA